MLKKVFAALVENTGENRIAAAFARFDAISAEIDTGIAEIEDEQDELDAPYSME
jgi:hypothetical protein